MKGRWNDWLRQAEDDMKWAQDTCRSEHWAQACFICQQAGGKALKAIVFASAMIERARTETAEAHG
jgi:HEPN domain-containing protein